MRIQGCIDGVTLSVRVVLDVGSVAEDWTVLDDGRCVVVGYPRWSRWVVCVNEVVLVEE